MHFKVTNDNPFYFWGATMSLMAQYSTQFLSEVWRKERTSMEIHSLSSTIKSLLFLTCNTLWFIPEAKYYKNNVSPTEYDQLLSALAAVKERYILLRTRELTQLFLKVATFWQIFHSPQRRSSGHCKEARSELPCVGCAQEENPPHTAPLCPWLWQGALRGTHSHECTCASTHQGKAWLLFCHYWHISQLGSLHLENEAPSGWEYLCLGRLPKTHPQLTYSSCQGKWSSDTNPRVCVCVKHTDSKREQDHEEGGQQNSRWWHMGQLQQPDLSQQGSIPPLATSSPTMLLSKIML